MLAKWVNVNKPDCVVVPIFNRAQHLYKHSVNQKDMWLRKSALNSLNVHVLEQCVSLVPKLLCSKLGVKKHFN